MALTGRKFSRPANLDIAAVLHGNLGPFIGNQDHEVRIRLRGFAAEDARTYEWHTSQQKVECADGSLEITLPLNNLVDIANCVLEWGPFAEVLASPALRTSLCDSLKSALAIYEYREEARQAGCPETT